MFDGYRLDCITAFKHHRGWAIYELPDGPVTGRFRAERYGVRLGAGTLAALISMIDMRETL